MITFIDHDLNFYRLKNNSGKKISIQQSRRSELPEDNVLKLDTKKKELLKCDYIFAYNKFVGKKYNSIIDGKIKYLGSFRSNEVDLNNKKKNIEILYISTYRKSIDEKAKNKNSFHYEYLKNEFKLLNTINKYCKNYKAKITVLGSSVDFPNEEKLFFSRYLEKNFNFLKRSRKTLII